MLDINSFTTSIKNQVLGWLSSIGTNLTVSYTHLTLPTIA